VCSGVQLIAYVCNCEHCVQLCEIVFVCVHVWVCVHMHALFVHMCAYVYHCVHMCAIACNCVQLWPNEDSHFERT
jgi:hypothetical protein